VKRLSIIAVIAASIGAGAVAAFAANPFPEQKFKKPMLISHYAAGEMECWSAGTSIVRTPVKDGFTAFQYAEDSRRLWIAVSGTQFSGDLVLGTDATCKFTGTRSVNLD
jgi:hypothetical protein